MSPARLPYSFARRNGAAIAPEVAGEVPRVLLRDDAALETVTEVRRVLGHDFAIEELGSEQFEQRLRELYAEGDSAAQQMADDLNADEDLQSLADALSEPTDLMESEDDAPIIKLLNALLTDAVREQASDIHVEPREDALLVRYRVDGVLREVLRPARAIAPLLVSRIKVMARLDIAEKRIPQDGRIGLKLAGRPIDVRVSTIPSNHGERVVLRLLDKQAGRLDLAELGMAQETRSRLEELIARPHGILLVTGPTGSGKTTTLYAAMGRLDIGTRNVMTVEDPVEYDLDGIAQTQVNLKADMTFARGLRAILRQDPDVVMVGEIRDLETAQIAVQASLTGHLVLSTLHTNTAVGAVTRLIDMGVPRFLIASSLIGVLAQRLVRKLDPDHRAAHQPTAAELEALGVREHAGAHAWRPDASDPGPRGGYAGRTGVYELIAIDETMRQAIHDGAGETELTRLARAQSPSLLADGWRQISAGVTSIDEVLRVTRQE